jgi:hypothetical protein
MDRHGSGKNRSPGILVGEGCGLDAVLLLGFRLGVLACSFVFLHRETLTLARILALAGVARLLARALALARRGLVALRVCFVGSERRADGDHREEAGNGGCECETSQLRDIHFHVRTPFFVIEGNSGRQHRY